MLFWTSNKDTIILSAYTRPAYNVTSRAHQLDIYVFEVKSGASSLFVPYQETRYFNLTKWLNRQLSYNIPICGPVAATQFMAIDLNTSSAPGPNFKPFAGSGQQNPPNNGQNGVPNLYPPLPPLNNYSGVYNTSGVHRPAGNGHYYSPQPTSHWKQTKTTGAGNCLRSNLVIVFFFILSIFNFIN